MRSLRVSDARAVMPWLAAETMGKMFIINAPTAFTVIWTFLKPFLHERTQAKVRPGSCVVVCPKPPRGVTRWHPRAQVEILGGRDAYLPRLLTCFDIDAIPVEFGGKLAVPGGIYPVTCVPVCRADGVGGARGCVLTSWCVCVCVLCACVCAFVSYAGGQRTR